MPPDLSHTRIIIITIIVTRTVQPVATQAE